jgi:MYXO-CTERM domain-containing protein
MRNHANSDFFRVGIMRTSCAAVLLGLLASLPARADVSVTVTTTPNGGPYAPKNVVAMWIEDAGGTFVKTIDRFSQARTSHLVAWVAAAGAGDADAVSGATRPNHVNPITATWNLRDKLGALVPDGTYTIRMELADSNASQPAQNHQGTFTFTKGAAPDTQSGLSNGGFINVSIDFQPVADTCNNGVVDSGEACDPSVTGSCPTACPAATDACMPNQLVGDAASCTAACVVQPITTCVDGDGCCAAGCTASNDSDCDGASGNGDLSGSCSTGGSGSALVLVGLFGLVFVRRSRR